MVPTLLCLLALSPPRFDGEGVPLPAEVLGRVGSARYRYPAWLSVPVASADGKRLYTHAGDDNALVVWEAGSGRLVEQFDLPGLSNGAGVVLPSGSTLYPNRFVPRDHRRLDPLTGGRLRVVNFAYGHGLVYTLDPATRAVTDRLEFRVPLGQRVELTRDGRRLVVHVIDVQRHASVDAEQHFLKVFDAATMKPAYEVPLAGPLHAVAVSPDDRWLAVSDSESLRLVDAATGKTVRELHGQGGEVVTDVQFGADAATVAGLVRRDDWVTRVGVWDTAAGRLRFEAAYADPPRGLGFGRRRLAGPPVHLVYRPDVNRLAVIQRHRDVQFFDATTGRPLAAVTDWDMTDGTFSPTGDRFYVRTGGRYTAWYPVDVTTPAAPRSLRPVGPLTQIVYPSAAAVVAAGGRDVLRGDLAAGTTRPAALDLPAAFGAGDPSAVSPDGRWFAAAAGDGMAGEFDVWLYDLTTGQPFILVARYRMRPRELLFTPDGTTLVARFQMPGELLTWDVRTKRTTVRTYTRPFPTGGRVDQLEAAGQLRLLTWEARNPDAVPLGRTERPGPLALFDFATFTVPARPVWQFVPPADRFAVHWLTRDGRGLLVETRTGPASAIELWDGPTGRRRWQGDPLANNTTYLTESPDGRTLAGAVGELLVLVEATTGKVRHLFFGHRAAVTAACFSPDGRTLAAASADAPVYVWDVAGDLVRPAAPPDLDAAWAGLAAADAAVAFRAVRRLAWFPDRSLPHLRAKLPPVAAVDADALAKRLAELDAPAFADREAAMKALKALGELAVPRLEQTLQQTESAETRARVERLLEAEAARPPTGETLRAVRAAEAVERIGTPAAVELLRSWAGGADGAALTREARAALGRRK